jgi:hypothetical protein
VSNEQKEKEIYFIKPEICDEINSKGQKNYWLHGQGSFDKKNIENVIDKNCFRGDKFKKNVEKLKNNIVSELVLPFELKNLNFPKDSVNLLVIDVQGFELEVLLSLSFNEKKQMLLKKLNKLKNETNANTVSINPNFKKDKI